MAQAVKNFLTAMQETQATWVQFPLGKIPGGGNGHPLQFSCLENPMNREACQATAHMVVKSGTQMSMHVHTQWTDGNSWKVIETLISPRVVLLFQGSALLQFWTATAFSLLLSYSWFETKFCPDLIISTFKKPGLAYAICCFQKENTAFELFDFFCPLCLPSFL